MLLLLAACEIATRPPVRIDSASPDILCDGSVTTVEVRGSGFSPLATDLLDDPTLTEPTLTLVRAGDPAGVEDGGERRLRPAWERIDDTTLRFDTPGGLPTGSWHLELVDPTGQQTAVLAWALVVLPPPVLTEASPASICVESEAAPLELRGSDFVALDGVPPTVTLGAADPVAATASDCSPLAGERDGEICTTLTLSLDASTQAIGEVAIVVSDAEPLACASTTPAHLEVTLPLEIIGVEPAITCSSGGAVVVTGERFPEEPSVSVGGVAVAAVTRIDAETLEIELAEGTPDGLVDVSVEGPDGCGDTLSDALEIVGSPDVFLVDPPASYNGLAVTVTAWVADATADVDATWLSDGATQTALDFTWDPDGRVTARVPAGLDPGSYAFGISETDGCATELADAFIVTDTLTVAIEEVDPAFAWTWDTTAIQVLATDPVPEGQVGFEDTPRLYLSASDGSAAAVQGVVFRDAGLLTAIIPDGLAVGSWDVLVVNPDGAVGALPGGLTVTEDPSPVVDSVSPVGLAHNADETITIHGAYFHDPTVWLECEEAGALTTIATTVTGSGYTAIEAVVPGGSASEAVCVVEVVNADGASTRWAAISIRNPSANLFGFAAGTELVEARRAPAAVAGRTSSVSRWVYAIGGDEGDAATARSTVERASVDVYGDLGAWQLLPTELPSPVTLGGAAIVGDFVWLVGGNDASSPVATVWRARILDPLEVVELESVSIDDGGALDPGVHTWKVASLYDAADEANPGGESLAGGPFTVTLPEGETWSVELTWTALGDAVGYRVYRDDAWAGDTTATSWSDAGDATDPSVAPLPEGALGEWSAMPTMLTARESPCVTVAPDPVPDPEIVYLYVGGGRDATGEPLDSVERLDVTVVGDGEQVVGSWASAEVTLSEARWACGAYTVDSALHTVVGTGESWVYFVGGETGTRTTGAADAGLVRDGGGLEEWGEVDSMSPARSGFGTASASNYLYAFGGQGGEATAGGASSELDADTIPELVNWNSLGISLSSPRWMPGSTQESSVIFLLGGATDTEDATRSTDVTNY